MLFLISMPLYFYIAIAEPYMNISESRFLGFCDSAILLIEYLKIFLAEPERNWLIFWYIDIWRKYRRKKQVWRKNWFFGFWKFVARKKKGNFLEKKSHGFFVERRESKYKIHVPWSIMVHVLYIDSHAHAHVYMHAFFLQAFTNKKIYSDSKDNWNILAC